MNEHLISLLALIVTLGLLISFHEFGHFWVARRLGVKVLRFSIGFGRPLWLRRGRVDGTEYAIAAVPLGGFVRMLDEREGEVPSAEIHRAFNRQPVGSRIAIVAAGPIFNFLFAILAFSAMYMIGVNALRPQFGEPLAGSSAAAGGFQSGDVVTAIADVSTATLDEVLLALVDHSTAETAIAVTVLDGKGQTQTRTLDLTGLAGKDVSFGALGLQPWQPPQPVIVSKLTPGSAAERAGFKPGDQIVAVDGQSVKGWQQWANYVRTHPGKTLAIDIERQGQPLRLAAVPETVAIDRNTSIGRLGVESTNSYDPTTNQIQVRYAPLPAFQHGIRKTWEMSWFTLRMLGRMVIGQASLKNLSGPLTIADYAGKSAQLGLSASLYFLALVSVSLAVLNLLPIPVLDGGHLLYYLIELVKGSPLSEIAQSIGQRIGLALILMLMGLALYNDFARYLVG